MMEPAVAFHDVTFRYFSQARQPVLDHLSLELEQGRVTLLMGSSGCGKSTLAALAAGLYPENGGVLESGDIRLFGRDVSEMEPQARAAWISMMFQNPDLQFCMDTLRKEMRFCLENIQVPREEMDSRIEETADRLGLSGLLDRKLYTMSGGEKQKAALCCLFLLDSRCFLLDEPFANIDPDSAAELAAMLGDMKRTGKTVIAVDHRPDQWLGLADEIIVLGTGGQVKARGITRDSLGQYRDLFEEEGLFWTGGPAQTGTGIQPAGDGAQDSGPGQASITFSDLSAGPGGRKKGLFRREQDPAVRITYGGGIVTKGTMTALLGPSGSGKTTFFKALLGQQEYRGSICLGGQEIGKMKNRELFSRIGIVFQNPASQFVTQNVLEEAEAGLRAWHGEMTPENRREEALKMLDEFQLKKYRKYSPYMLSQGQQRRLAVLAMLAGGQEVLLLDEPTYGQDGRSTREIMEQLAKRVKEGLTVVFSTHDRELARRWADQIWLLTEDGIREVGTER